MAPKDLEALQALPPEERIGPLIELAHSALEGPRSPSSDQALIDALLPLLMDGVGTARERLALGEALAGLGDPRLQLPQDDGYWVDVPYGDTVFRIARYPVTVAEFRRFVEVGGYRDDAAWSEEGRAWRDAVDDPWPVRFERLPPEFRVGNQPVVQVSWWEAQAYARWAGARLPTAVERMAVVRGEERRPYPWGAPFGHGNANTREEVLKRPCAVGLYVRDCTPEGVYDLAGNVAEWLEDEVEQGRVIHPGSWRQPSMASWAKARGLEDPSARRSDLGFRLMKD